MLGTKDGITSINTHVDGGSNTATKILQLARAINCVDTVYSVATEADLPPAEDNRGRWYFVEDVIGYRWSDGQEWTNDPNSINQELLWTWGGNSSGQLGDGTTTAKSSPGTVVVEGGWVEIGNGSSHCTAIKTDGTLWSWGSNSFGALGIYPLVPLAESSPVQVSGGGKTWDKVSAGSYTHTLATKTDGTLWTWGYNLRGQLGDNTTTNRSSPVTTRGGGNNWDKVSAGQQHSIATKTDGTLWTWGYNLRGELGDNTTTSRSSPVTTAGGGTTWDKVAAGFTFSIATKTDGTLWTWGDNTTGKLGDNTTTSRSSPGTTIGGGTTWDKVAAGSNHAIATKTDGTLWTWGYNLYGRLGDGTTTSRRSPVTTAGGGTNWNNIACGKDHSIATKTDGTLWTWGLNTSGQLGDGTTTAKSSPVTTVGVVGTNWDKVEAGYEHTLSTRIRGFKY
jgi:alpha-tubulin suppressor-like RCC1 family protein